MMNHGPMTSAQAVARRHDELQRLATVMRHFREARGLTQEGLAATTGGGRGIIGEVERGDRNVGFRKLRGLLRALEVTWPEFGAALHVADPLASRSLVHQR